MDATFKLVVSLIENGFEGFQGEFSPETNLTELVKNDPEQIEWMLEHVQAVLKLEWPRDERGRRLQLFLGERLTVADLCDVVEGGCWPLSWTRPGKVLWF